MKTLLVLILFLMASLSFADLPQHCNNVDWLGLFGSIPDECKEPLPLPSVPIPSEKEEDWAAQVLDLKKLWARNVDCSKVKVAVLDSGIDPNHPAFAEIKITQKNVYSSDQKLNDDHYHGTHVAGIIFAKTKQKRGLGVCNSGDLLVVKTSNEEGIVTTSDYANAIVEAVKWGAQVINASLGGKAMEHTVLLQRVIEASPNSFFIFPSGNSGDNNAIYPASFTKNFQNVISVGSSDPDDGPTIISNLSKTEVDLLAPGYSIYSSTPTYLTQEMAIDHISENYAFLSGTSMAAPFVAGVAAAYWSEHPELKPSDFKKKIIEGVLTVDRLKDITVSGGRLSLKKLFGFDL